MLGYSPGGSHGLLRMAEAVCRCVCVRGCVCEGAYHTTCVDILMNFCLYKYIMCIYTNFHTLHWLPPQTPTPPLPLPSPSLPPDLVSSEYDGDVPSEGTRGVEKRTLLPYTLPLAPTPVTCQETCWKRGQRVERTCTSLQ